MIFPSHIFLLLFLPLTLLAWFALPTQRLKLLSITLASYIFYGWWDWRFTGLMLGSSLLDFFCGRAIGRARAAADAGSPAARQRARFWLVVALTGNLSTLGFFKYYDFFAASLNALLEGAGVAPPLTLLHLVLPIGISFYTFQAMSYSIDVYRGQCRATDSFLRFAAFVSLFPQLVAGPIVRYSEMEEQFDTMSGRPVSYGQIADGAWLFVIGLVKKIWIADALAPAAARAFDDPSQVQFFTAWVGTLCYTLQLYFDFSGYSDMARGLGKIMGFEFPINFNSPYQSANVSEFWNRWHISLSHWLRDYLYIPLGGSRGGPAQTARNLLITMLLGGLWHGAAWTFVLWGLYHGGLLVLHAAWRRRGRSLPRVLAVPSTLFAVAVGWVVFRAATLEGACSMYAGMLGLHGIEPLTVYSHTLGLYLPALYGAFGGMHGLLFLAVAAGMALWSPNSQALPKPRHGLAAVGLAAVVLFSLTTIQTELPFLYYQF